MERVDPTDGYAYGLIIISYAKSWYDTRLSTPFFGKINLRCYDLKLDIIIFLFFMPCLKIVSMLMGYTSSWIGI